MLPSQWSPAMKRYFSTCSLNKHLRHCCEGVILRFKLIIWKLQLLLWSKTFLKVQLFRRNPPRLASTTARRPEVAPFGSSPPNRSTETLWGLASRRISGDPAAEFRRGNFPIIKFKTGTQRIVSNGLRIRS